MRNAHARYVVEGEVDGLTIVHHGDEVTLSAGRPRELDVPELKPLTDPPRQPVGREPESV